MPYRNATSVTIAENKIFCGTQGGIFYLDRDDNSIHTMNRTEGLSGTNIAQVKYNEYNNTLLIAYTDANIDLYSNYQIHNISDIKRDQDIIGRKDINHVHFVDNLAYLSTSFGIVVLNMEKREIKDTYIIGSNGTQAEVYSVTTNSDKIFAATNEGIKVADLTNPNLNNFNFWEQYDISDGLPEGESHHISEFEGSIFAEVNDTLYQLENNSWSRFYSDSLWEVASLTSSDDRMLLIESIPDSAIPKRVILFDQNFTADTLLHPYTSFAQEVTTFKDGTVWIADLAYGLVRYEDTTFASIFPNGPATTNVQKIYVFDNEVWVAPGTINPFWTKTFNNQGFYVLSKNWWNSPRPWIPAFDSIFDIASIAKGKDNKTYLGSFGEGVVELTDGQVTNVYKQESSLQKDPRDPARYKVSSLAVDNDNNLWVSNFHAPNPISVKTPDGKWKAFTPKINIPLNQVGEILIDNMNQKWVVLPRGNGGVLVFNDNNTIEDESDDQYTILGLGEGNGNLPSVDITSIAKDRDGEIWVGTLAGVAVFYCPENVFSQGGCDAQQIPIEIGGYVGYLLESENVQAIAVDGANRKWFGTTNGVWLMSPDGTEQISRFTTDNSPLLSNNVVDIAINHETGEVFFATDKGIISYRAAATKGEEKHKDVLVYPNPVPKDYSGLVAIKGLTEDAYVKITDISGNLVYETTALGGQVTWNGLDLNGRRPRTGVYLVFSTNENGTETFTAKFVIIN